MPSNLDQSINEVNKVRDNINKAAEAEDKNGDNAADEPAVELYNALTDSTIKILSLDAVKKAFKNIADNLNDETAKSLAELMALCMTHSAFEAIVYYDDLLKTELTKQFDSYGDCLNKTMATVNAHDSVIKILRKRLEEFTNTKINDELK